MFGWSFGLNGIQSESVNIGKYLLILKVLFLFNIH